MQTAVNSSSDDGSSTAMTLDDIVLPHLKKRTLDADVLAATNSSSFAPPSPTKIQATNPDGSCDITWSEVLQLLSPLRNYEPTFLPLNQLQLDSRWIITEETLQAIGSLRERTYMPHTFARDRFDSWHARKGQDDCLSEEHLYTVLHFLDILYTDVSISSIHLGLLGRHMVTHFPGAYCLHMSAGPIEGLNTYIML